MMVVSLMGVVGSSAGWSQSDVPQLLENNVLMRADNITYDESFGIITARGNVEVSRGNRVLLADTLSYNRRDNVIIASGTYHSCLKMGV